MTVLLETVHVNGAEGLLALNALGDVGPGVSLRTSLVMPMPKRERMDSCACRIEVAATEIRHDGICRTTFVDPD